MEFTTEQQQAIWEGWRDGESFRQVGDRVGQPAHAVQYFLRSMVPIPFLSLLADKDGLEQVGARFRERAVTDCPEVRDGQFLTRYLVEEEKSERRVSGVGEGLQLMEGRVFAAGLPDCQAGSSGNLRTRSV